MEFINNVFLKTTKSDGETLMVLQECLIVAVQIQEIEE